MERERGVEEIVRKTFTLSDLDWLDLRITLIKDYHDFMLYEDLTRRIIGCAMEVHKRLGNGFQEVIYQRALKKELEHAGLLFEREMKMTIYYRDEESSDWRMPTFHRR